MFINSIVKNDSVIKFGKNATVQVQSPVNNQIDGTEESETQVNSMENFTKNIYPKDTISVYKQPSGSINTSWFYVSDVHGKMTKIERMFGMANEFNTMKASDRTKFYKKNDEVAKFCVASGDIILGDDYKNNQVANMLLNKGDFLASALGNHEVDNTNPHHLADLLAASSYVMLAANLDVAENSPLKPYIKKSIIKEQDGVKIGIIGIAPSDMNKRVKINDTLKDLKVYDVDKTIFAVKEEVEKLRNQGINIIVLLSHSGSNNDKIIAQETEGIDIIFGGHTHDLYEGIEEGQNLLYSKSGEPVILTQIGKDGEHTGILNVVFDENGVIKKAQNNVMNVEDYNRPVIVKKEVENVIGKAEIVGQVSYAEPAPKNRLLENNPHGNLIVDAMRHELGTQIALLQPGCVRGYFSKGEIDNRLLSDIAPFAAQTWEIELTEPQIVKAIKYGCDSVNKSSNKPGILLVSGMTYKLNKQGKLLELNYIDENNKPHKIDINNPDPNKKYTVAADDFFSTGGDGYLESNEEPEFVKKKYFKDKSLFTQDYIKKLKQPIEIRKDNRIEIMEDVIHKNQ